MDWRRTKARIPCRLRRTGGPGPPLQAVTKAGDCGDVATVAVAELGPQPADEQVHALCPDVGVVAVDLTHDLVARHRRPGVARQLRAEAELERAPCNGLVTHADFVR